MSLYMPGAVQRPQPGGVTLDTSLPARFIWHITWDQLRADGTQPDFSAVADYLIGKQYCPHIMWNPFTGYMEQYYPADVGGRALAYNNQDGTAAVQVEVFFTPGCIVDGVKYNTVADTPLVGWEDLLAWGDSLGVPRTWPMGAPQWQNNPRDVGIWNGNGGHYGHCHSPGDNHTDPGPMPSLGAITPQSTTTTPKEWDDMATEEQIRKVVREEAGNFWFTNSYGRPVQIWSILAAIDQHINGNHEITQSKIDATPANVLNQSFKLPDGTGTNLAGILAAIHAAPATVTNVGGTSIDVDALVARLKAELPSAVLTELSSKLSK